MARNPVQFQKGISLNEFLSLYGTEQQCSCTTGDGPTASCARCGHDRGCQPHTSSSIAMLQPPDLITAGTIFEALPLKGGLLHDPGQERCIGDEAAPPTRHLLQRRIECATS